MSDVHRENARTHLRDLKHLLASADADDARRLAADCDELDRAIDAFHMEGIRFRMYTLTHQFEALGPSVPPQAKVKTLLEEARAALQAAGFKTR